jgi:hypothetical protein
VTDETYLSTHNSSRLFGAAVPNVPRSRLMTLLWLLGEVVVAIAGVFLWFFLVYITVRIGATAYFRTRDDWERKKR